MILRFGASNMRSIRNYVELSMVATRGIKDRGPDLLKMGGGTDGVLPVAMLYGANASGKSAIFNSFMQFKNHIINSFSRRAVTGGIQRPYFLLDPKAKGEPSKLDCDFLIGGVRYHYGFEFNSELYTREWLYYFPEGYRRMLFEREGSTFDFGKSLRGQNKSVSDITRQNSLYLSAGAQAAHVQLTEIYNFFNNNISGISTSFNDGETQRRIANNPDTRIIEFLRHADTGISDVKVERKPTSRLTEKMYESLFQVFNAESELAEVSNIMKPPAEEVKILFSHMNRQGKPNYLAFSSESRGTRRLASLISYIFQALDSGTTIFIDEIDASLHTLLSGKIVELFSSSISNPNGAQLIATTHDTNLLCSKYLRRDQIWFTEKDEFGETNLYPLTDIKTRNSDNIEKGYLQGRYGAIPYLGSIDRLMSGDSGE